jgi:TolB-like protein
VGSAKLKSIAVLPFDNLSADAENAFFADGIHEDVLTQLSRIGDLTVISRTSVMAYRDASTPLVQIARELNVGSILEGSVRRSGDDVRITAQLIDAETDRHLWADNFDRALTAANVFAIQTEIAQRIADALAATLSPQEESRIAHQPTENLEAYEATLRGRESYRFYTAGGNDEAIRLFRLAIEGDPEYAEPWAGLADAFGQRVLRYGYGPEWADSAQAAADRALELDPELATAYKAAALARVAVGDFEGSIDLNLRAIELDPNYADPMMNIGVAYGAVGRLVESLRFTRRGFRLQPNVAFARANLGFAYATLGDFPTGRTIIGEALAIDPADLDAKTTLLTIGWFEGDTTEVLRLGEELQAMGPDIPFALAYVADAHLFAGQYQRALDVARHSLTISPDQGIVGSRHIGVLQGFAQRRLGDTSAARAILQAQLDARQASWDSAPGSGNTVFQIATIHAATGNADEALGWLERHGDLALNWTYFLSRDPMWDELRGAPRFEAVLAGMLVKVEEMRREIEREDPRAGNR